jgi:hypothetical protein
MKIPHPRTKPACGCCSLSRRRFLAHCAACAAGATGASTLAPPSAGADQGDGKARVRVVFTHISSDRPIWPNIGYDFDKRKRELIQGLRQSCPEIEFLPATAMNATEAKNLLAADTDKSIEGYLVYMLGLWTRAPQAIGASGRPTVFVDDLYGGSGEFLIANAAARRAGQNVVGVSTSRLEDVAAVVRCFTMLKRPGATVEQWLSAADKARRDNFAKAGDLSCTADPMPPVNLGGCVRKLRESTILVIGRDPGRQGTAIQEIFGTTVKPVSFQELQQAYLAADHDEAEKWADRWMGTAERVIEPSRDEIIRSGAMYAAMRAILNKHNAQAIAINCLRGFYGGHITAYPCLGFFQMNNEDLVGACEADLRSTITMLAMRHLTGRPGYISDPVIDTSKNQIIYAHCVAPNKVFGPEGPSNPYHIRNHSEDRQGAAVRSLMPLGYMTTTIETNVARKEMIMHQGKSVENIDDDMACRTKLAVEVKGDMDKLLSHWDRWGWHRVTFYGNLKEPIQELTDALGLTLIEEA